MLLFLVACIRYPPPADSGTTEEQDSASAAADTSGREPGGDADTDADTDTDSDTDSGADDTGAPATRGLVGDWRFDGDARDVSGWGNDGVVSGARLTADRFGSPESAYLFDGLNDVVTVPDSPSLSSPESAQTVTIAAWIRVDGWYQDWNIFSILEKYRSRDDGGWEFAAGAVPSPSLAFAPALYQEGLQQSWTTFAFGEWHHVVAVYDHGDETLYLDGELFAAGSTSVPMTDTEGGPIHIGLSTTGPDEYSDGAIDDVLLYDVALTPGEVLALE